jgi:hypothetical protein
MQADPAHGPHRQMVFGQQPLQKNEGALLADVSAGFVTFRNQRRETRFASARGLRARSYFQQAAPGSGRSREIGMIRRFAGDDNDERNLVRERSQKIRGPDLARCDPDTQFSFGATRQHQGARHHFGRNLSPADVLKV